MRDKIEIFCSKIGNNPLITQAAGGNVSWKEKNKLFIKASGTWLADAGNKNIFAEIRLDTIKDNILNGDFSIPSSAILSKNNKPSIETTMHAILPQKIVVHVHAVNIVAILIRKNSNEIVKNILKDSYKFSLIEYCQPGAVLAKAMDLDIQQNGVKDVYFLKNHGIVIANDSLKEIEKLLDRILTSFSNYIHKDIPSPSFKKQNLDNSEYLKINSNELTEILNNKKFLQFFMQNPILTPDQLIFLGRNPINMFSYKDFYENKIKKNIEFFYVEDYGFFCSKSISESLVAQIQCLASLIIRQDELADIVTLSNSDVQDLLSMDSEKYRFSIAK